MPLWLAEATSKSARTAEASGCSALFSFHQIIVFYSVEGKFGPLSWFYVFIVIAVLISFVVLTKSAVAKLQLALPLSVINNTTVFPSKSKN